MYSLVYLGLPIPSYIFSIRSEKKSVLKINQNITTRGINEIPANAISYQKGGKEFTVIGGSEVEFRLILLRFPFPLMRAELNDPLICLRRFQSKDHVQVTRRNLHWNYVF